MIETASVAVGSAIWVYFIAAISYRLRKDRLKQQSIGNYSQNRDYEDGRIRNAEA